MAMNIDALRNQAENGTYILFGNRKAVQPTDAVRDIVLADLEAEGVDSFTIKVNGVELQDETEIPAFFNGYKVEVLKSVKAGALNIDDLRGDDEEEDEAPTVEMTNYVLFGQVKEVARDESVRDRLVADLEAEGVDSFTAYVNGREIQDETDLPEVFGENAIKVVKSVKAGCIHISSLK